MSIPKEIKHYINGVEIDEKFTTVTVALLEVESVEDKIKEIDSNLKLHDIGL